MIKLTAKIVQRAKRETIDWLRGNPSDYFKIAFPEARYAYIYPRCVSDMEDFCSGAMLGAFINHLVGVKFSDAKDVGETIYGDENTFFLFTSKGIDTRCPHAAADYLESLVELPEYRTEEMLRGAQEFDDKRKLQELADKLGYDLVKRTTPDTFSDWDALDPRFKFITRDEDGAVYAYTSMPIKGPACWLPHTGTGQRVDTVLTGHTPGTCDWTQSLIQRPFSDN